MNLSQHCTDNNHRSRQRDIFTSCEAQRLGNTNFIRNMRKTLWTFEINISTSFISYYHARISNTTQQNYKWNQISKEKGERCFIKRKNIINQKLEFQTKKAIDDASQSGASSWLSAIPLEQYGFKQNIIQRCYTVKVWKTVKGFTSYMSLWPEVRYCTCFKLQKSSFCHD